MFYVYFLTSKIQFTLVLKELGKSHKHQGPSFTMSAGNEI